MELFTSLFTGAGLPLVYRFDSNHIQSYLFLHSKVQELVNNGYCLKILDRPLGVENWLQSHGTLSEITQEQEAQRTNQTTINVEGTDDEENNEYIEQGFDDASILDMAQVDDNYRENFYIDNDDEQDDGIVYTI
ncbi:hypothetical protein DFH27DRAFT_607702 [Peziza echinospora]|nr:hypothetical protein DFH27DRAFT_607702 [Peziza echinospora]